MKSDKNKNLFLLLMCISIFIFGFPSVFGAITLNITTQNSTFTGSNNSLITLNKDIAHPTQYVNIGDDSTVIGNYLSGSYYDSVYGFFRFDWSTDRSKNVRIVGSTSKCPSGYGYKFGGQSYSSYAGYVDFNYSANTFVYYCMLDKKLYGEAYSPGVGYQRFQGITFDITPLISQQALTQQNSGTFVNDKTTITTLSGKKIDNFDTNFESMFYIIK